MTKNETNKLRPIPQRISVDSNKLYTVYFVTGLLRLRLIEIELDDRLMEIGDVLAHGRHLAGICTYLELTDSRMLALTSGQQML